MKQAILAAALSLSLAALAAPQDSAPVVTLNDVKTCRGNIPDKKGCVTPPRLTYAPKPKYPTNERKARHQGIVKLKLVVGSDGVPRKIAVSQTLSPDFDKSAINAVKQWKFKPAIKDGKPIPLLIALDVEFHLKH